MANKKRAGKKHSSEKALEGGACRTPELPDEDRQYFDGDETGSSPDEDTEMVLNGRLP